MSDLKGAEDDLRLHRGNLTDGELGKVVQVLLGKDLGCLPAAHLPLYHRDDGVALVASMPLFNERGLMPSGPPDSPVEVSSNKGSIEGEEEGEDSEATHEEMGVFLTTTTPGKAWSGGPRVSLGSL